ncbi:MAG: nitrite reductase, copper-containing [Anaerolineae bacterium]|nr:nitrite reductase, copper-containing [Anaerolineae bacterium]
MREENTSSVQAVPQEGAYVTGIFLVVLVAVVVLMLLPSRTQVKNASASAPESSPTKVAEVKAAAPAADGGYGGASDSKAAAEAPTTGKTIHYALKTNFGGEPAMSYIGVGGEIEGKVNPTLTAEVGDTIKITLVNADGTLHNFVMPAFGIKATDVAQKGTESEVEFVATTPGEFEYYCEIPGHQQIGMKGLFKITGTVQAGERAALADAKSQEPATAEPVNEPAPAASNAVSIVRNPADVPPPVGNRPPMTLRVDMSTVEVTGILADGTTFNYFTFDGKVPGPMLRVRIGDTVEFHLKNDDKSLFPHSIDLHAVTGPGGGAVYTQTTPGGETAFVFKAINVGLYVYHCATASIPHHISSGMYGLILVEPEGGLPPVDREFYVMQGEIYTDHDFGTQGHLNFDAAKMSHEQPEYFVFNGAVGGLTSDQNALRAKVGETVRIYFGVGGPNFISSFHVIGEIFDRVYDQASLTAAPLTDVQTTIVPTGGATMVEFKVDVPGRYILVDHSLSRLERGLAGYLIVEGEPQPEIFEGTQGESAGH